MAILGAQYGVSYYFDDFYGELRLQEFDAGPLSAKAYSHASLLVRWFTPSGAWSRMRLVRSNYGPPVNEEDGLVLFDRNFGPGATGTKDPGITELLDTDLTPGNHYYYGIWLLSTTDRLVWRPAGNVVGLAPAKYGYSDRMVERLPSIFTTEPAAAGEAQGDEGGILRAFLDIFGFHLDGYRTELEALRRTNDPDRVSGKLIPAMAEQYGISYEPEIGIAQTRAQIRNAAYTYKVKGTRLGLEAAVSALSGWGAECPVGSNLFLDYNDSSFEESIGRWTPQTNCSLSRYAADGSIAAYEEASGSATYPNKRLGLLRVTATGAGSTEARCGDSNPVLLGVPVVPASSYTLSGYFRGQVARNVRVAVRWYDINGAFLSSNTGANSTASTTVYVRAAVSAAAPAGAAFAVPVLAVDAMGAGEHMYADAFQLEMSGTASAFQDARLIRTMLTANRVNEVKNPRVASNTTGYLPKDSGTITRVTDKGHSDLVSLKVDMSDGPVGSEGVRYTFSAGELKPSQNYTASVWVFVPTGGTPVRMEINGDVEVTVVGQDTGIVYDTWQRLDLVFQTNETRVADVYVEVTNEAVTAAPATFWIDELLVERGVYLREYFDAASYTDRPADYLWEGTPHASRSHFYFNRTAKSFRLDALLTKSVHHGSTFSLNFAHPST